MVEDEAIVRLSLGYQLTEEGFDVDTVESGAEAIEKLGKDSSYDLVITDLMMYGESGVDVFKQAIEIDANFPVMIITGFGPESPLFKEAMKLKPCSYAFKPFSKEEILKKVSICLERANRKA